MKLIVPKYPNRAACYKANRLEILANGLQPVRAKCDEQGNCTTCGEAGRCPGWHPANETNETASERFELQRAPTRQRPRERFQNVKTTQLPLFIGAHDEPGQTYLVDPFGQ